MKVAILYICTGKYAIFWKDFYAGCEKHFLPGVPKTYFVFTDSEISEEENYNMRRIYQEKLGWPKDTLMRFHLFSSIEDELKHFDYIFFFNANTHFLKTVDASVLQNNGTDADLIFTKHPFFYGVTDPAHFPYERNKRSTAFIPKKKGRYYVLGGFNGGKSPAYLRLINTLKSQIDIDNKKKMVAIWHDESHLNKYLLENKDNHKILDYNYGFPEGHDLPLKNDVYVQFLDKTKFGGHDFLREKENSIPVMRHSKRSRISALMQVIEAILPFS